MYAGGTLRTVNVSHFRTTVAKVENGERSSAELAFISADEEEGTSECWTLQSPENVIGLFQGFTLIKHFRASERGPTDIGSWQDSMIFQAKADGIRSNSTPSPIPTAIE